MGYRFRQDVAGWTAYASGLLAAVGIAFLIPMFVSFAVGAATSGRAFGQINDVLVMASYALAVPSTVALRSVLQPQTRRWSDPLALIGVGSMVAIVILQLLLVVGALTFEEQFGFVSIAGLVLGGWFVATGYLARSNGLLPHGVRDGLLAAGYVGYPIWAFNLGRHLLRPVGRPERPEPKNLGPDTALESSDV